MEEEDNSVTMVDVLKEQEAFEEDAKAVLGASDDKNCTYLLGYIKRQALYACLTCCPESVNDPTLRAGLCLACSLACHENHNLIELYTKRNFRCDCGGPKFSENPCTFNGKKTDENNQNHYSQNFSGLYCICHRPYPDPEDSIEDDMIQCIVCEDWFHSRHLDAKLPASDQYSEMICQTCMDENEFLNHYSCYEVIGTEEHHRFVKKNKTFFDNSNAENASNLENSHSKNQSMDETLNDSKLSTQNESQDVDIDNTSEVNNITQNQYEIDTSTGLDEPENNTEGKPESNVENTTESSDSVSTTMEVESKNIEHDVNPALEDSKRNEALENIGESNFADETQTTSKCSPSPIDEPISTDKSDTQASMEVDASNNEAEADSKISTDHNEVVDKIVESNVEESKNDSELMDIDLSNDEVTTPQLVSESENKINGKVLEDVQNKEANKPEKHIDMPKTSEDLANDIEITEDDQHLSNQEIVTENINEAIPEQTNISESLNLDSLQDDVEKDEKMHIDNEYTLPVDEKKVELQTENHAESSASDDNLGKPNSLQNNECSSDEVSISETTNCEKSDDIDTDKLENSNVQDDNSKKEVSSDENTQLENVNSETKSGTDAMDTVESSQSTNVDIPITEGVPISTISEENNDNQTETTNEINYITSKEDLNNSQTSQKAIKEPVETIKSFETDKIYESSNIQSEKKNDDATEETLGDRTEETLGVATEEKLESESKEKDSIDTEENLDVESKKKDIIDSEEKGGIESKEKDSVNTEKRLDVESKENDSIDTEEKLDEESKKDSVDTEEKLEESEEKDSVDTEEKLDEESKEKDSVDTAEKLYVESEEKDNVDTEEKLDVESKEKYSVDTEEKLDVESKEKYSVDTEEKLDVESKEKYSVDTEEKLDVESKEKYSVDTEEKLDVESKEKDSVDTEEKLDVESKEKVSVDTEEKLDVESKEKENVDTEGKIVIEFKEENIVDTEEKLDEEKHSGETEEKLGDKPEEKRQDVDEEMVNDEAEEKLSDKPEEVEENTSSKTPEPSDDKLVNESSQADVQDEDLQSTNSKINVTSSAEPESIPNAPGDDTPEKSDKLENKESRLHSNHIEENKDSHMSTIEEPISNEMRNAEKSDISPAGGDSINEPTSDKKRKQDCDSPSTNGIPVKKKIKQEICIKECTKPPLNHSGRRKSAAFWPSDWRSKLCCCSACLDIYVEKNVLFLLDSEDTVIAYEDLGKIKTEASSQYEKGMEALSSLGHVQQINAITEYNKMKEKLLEFLKTFKDKKEIVREEDIKGFFAGMKPKREPDGVYFCR